MIKKNSLKVFLGYFAGLPLLNILINLPIWLIGFIQMVFFAGFYTFLDVIFDKINDMKIESIKPEV